MDGEMLAREKENAMCRERERENGELRKKYMEK